MRPNELHSASVTPVYFYKDIPATPSTPMPVPAASHPAPELPSATKSDTEPEVHTQAETAEPSSGDKSSGKDEGQALTPFPTWSMNPKPSGFAVFGHQIKTALPVFTPDPPILHSEIPEPARGKDVVMDVVIDAQGTIIQVQVLQGVGYGVESSIVQTLRRWIFVPAKVNGVAIASRRQLRFHFPS